MLPPYMFETMPEDLQRELHVSALFNTEANVLIIVGDNASGKSLLRRWFSVRMREKKIEVMHISQEGRSDRDFSAGIGHLMIYGSENDESTGYNSAKTMMGAFRTSWERTTPHAIIFDEPDIGMGEELQLGCANWMSEQMRRKPEFLAGLIVMTHSRHFVNVLSQLPGSLFLSLSGHKAAEEWLNRKIVPVYPEEVIETGKARWRSINISLQEMRKRKGAEGKITVPGKYRS